MYRPRPRTMPASRKLLAVAATTALVAALFGLPSPASAVAPAPAAGAQTSGDSLFPNVGNGGYDVRHYDVDLAYDFDTKAIDAKTTIKATADHPLSSFSLDFEGLTVHSVTVDGKAAAYTRDNDAATTRHKLVITPKTPVHRAFTTVITYSGVPASHTDPDDSSEGWVQTDDGATAVAEPVGAMTWYPDNNTTKDKATYDISLKIPTTIGGKNAAGVSNGELTSKVRTGATTTWRWKQRKQMAPYLSMVSIGAYDVHQSTIGLASGRKIKEWSFIDSGLSAQDKQTTNESRTKIGPILRYMEKRFGPYPGNSTGLLVDDTDLGYALETQDRPFFERSADEETVVHELVHQWFGDAVSATDWSDLWLAEGPATFLTTDYEHVNGSGPTTNAAYFGQWNTTPADDPLWTTPMAAFTDPADLFGWQVYDRGAMTLEALRTTIGTADLFTTMRQWIAQRNGSTGSTKDFQSLAEDVTGLDLTSFFTDWAYEGNRPAWPSTQTSNPAPKVAGEHKVHRTHRVSPGT
ncbi:M1 family metallopeptidase [Aeromicrobium sp.]|uniref:M1 family metallopeptidase n=1 Tax=Aeromicrobium sp. TaxID=1871063 RepID=UPI0019B916E5|nr:M1 family metallopeptidase [Aeromicrobium sp.]MBC7633012.1 M1 family metallopeptidase [Aeromicrobium sp.]